MLMARDCTGQRPGWEEQKCAFRADLSRFLGAAPSADAPPRFAVVVASHKNRPVVFRADDLRVHFSAMRRKLVFTCLASALLGIVASQPAHATEVGYSRTFGLGFELGDPTGFVGKYWVSKTNALDFGIGFWGYSWGYCNEHNPCNAGYQNYSFHLDYLWQSNLVKSTAQLDWHIGAGARALVWNYGNSSHAAIGGRMPVGLDLMFNNPGFVEIFFELAPALYIPFGFNIEAGLGARFYF